MTRAHCVRGLVRRLKCCSAIVACTLVLLSQAAAALSIELCTKVEEPGRSGEECQQFYAMSPESAPGHAEFHLRRFLHSCTVTPCIEFHQQWHGAINATEFVAIQQGLPDLSPVTEASAPHVLFKLAQNGESLTRRMGAGGASHQRVLALLRDAHALLSTRTAPQQSEWIYEPPGSRSHSVTLVELVQRPHAYDGQRLRLQGNLLHGSWLQLNSAPEPLYLRIEETRTYAQARELTEQLVEVEGTFRFERDSSVRACTHFVGVLVKDPEVRALGPPSPSNIWPPSHRCRPKRQCSTAPLLCPN